MHDHSIPARSFRSRLRRWFLLGAVSFLWVLFVLYPNPTLLGRSIPQAIYPDIDPDSVAGWVDDLPEDPAEIERMVLREFVPYALPWQTYGVPWYFPTTAEVVEKGEGDCQARMLVLASLLEAKGIPYEIKASLDHIWVEYATKQPNRIENDAIAVMDDGKIQVPERWDWRETYRIEKEYYWDAMPFLRKVTLFGGLLLIAVHRLALKTTNELLVVVRRHVTVNAEAMS